MSARRNEVSEFSLQKDNRVDAVVLPDHHAFHPFNYNPGLTQLQLLQKLDMRKLYINGDFIDFEAIVNCLHLDLEIEFKDFPSDFETALQMIQQSRKPFSNIPIDYACINTVFHLAAHGVETEEIPGNHDAPTELWIGSSFEEMTIKEESIYRAPDGRLWLIRHGNGRKTDPFGLDEEHEGPHKGKNVLGYKKYLSATSETMAFDHFIHNTPSLKNKLPSALRQEFGFSNLCHQVADHHLSGYFPRKFEKFRDAMKKVREAGFSYLEERNASGENFAGLIVGHFHNPKITEKDGKFFIDAGDGQTHGNLTVHDQNSWHILNPQHLPQESLSSRFAYETHAEQLPKTREYLQTQWLLTLAYLAKQLDMTHGTLDFSDLFDQDRAPAAAQTMHSPEMENVAA